MNDIEVYAGAVLLGAVAGLRSMSAPAMLGKAAQSGLLPTSDSALSFLGGSKANYALSALAAGELIADKLPFLPNRTETGPLLIRAIAGGMSGGAICAAKKRSVLLGVLFGAAGAIGAAYGAYELRRRAGKQFNIPDRVVALAEDALVAGAGVLITSRLRAASA